MKQKKRTKTVTEAKPSKRRLSGLFSRNRPETADSLHGDQKTSDWHPCSGPFPTD
ncbi:MAG: hypothetical protein AAFW65_05070 [Pseudomonadota bacterium]